MATPTGPGGVNSTIRVDLDDSRLVAAMDRLEGRFANSTKAMVSSMSKLRKAVDADFTGIGRDSSKTGDIIAKSIESGFDRVIAASHKGEKAMSSFTKSSKDDLGTLTVQIRHTAEAMALYTKRVEELGRANDAAFNRADTARANVEAQHRQQQFRLAAQAMIEDEKRVTESLRFEQRRQLENLRTSDSLTRIREQASQQKRLALWQGFYRSIGQFGENFARQIGDGAGAGLRRLFTREKSELDRREGLWRGNEKTLTGIEESGQRSRLNILGRYFDRRRALLSESFAREARLSSSPAGEALGARANRGVLGGVLNATPLGYLGAGAAVTGLVGSIGGALKVTSDYTSALKELKAVAKPSDEILRKIDETSIKLGNDAKLPGVSAKDAADAFRLLTVSGIELQTSLDGAAEGSLQLSRAVGASAEDSAKAVAAGINTFKLTGKEALGVADILAKATSISGSTLTEFNDSFKQVGSTLYSLFKTAEPGKQLFTELSGVLALFAKNGLRGESAGTALKTMFTKLINPQGKATNVALDDIVKSAGKTGTVLYDAAGKTRTLYEAFDILRKGFAAMPSEGERAAKWVQIFGQRAGPQGVTKLLGATNEEFEAMFKNLDLTGFAAERAAAKNSGYKGGLDALSSSVETIAIKFGRVLQPVIRAATIFLSDFLTNLTEGDGVWKQIRFGLLGVAAGLTAIVAVKGVGETLGFVRTAIAALSASPLGILGVALAGAAAAIGVLIAKNPAFLKTLKDTGKNLLELVNPGAIFSEVVKTISGVIEKLTTVVIPKAIGAVKDFVGGFTNADTRGPAGFFTNLGRSASNALGTVITTLGLVRDAIMSGFDGLTDESGFLGFVQGIGNVLSGALVTARAFADSISDIFSSDASIGDKLLDSIGALVPAIKRGILSLPEEISTPITKALTKVGDFIESAVLEPVRNTVAKVQGIWRDSFGKGSIGEESGILAGLGNLLNTLTKMLGRTLTAMVTDPTLLKTLATVMAAAAAIAITAIQGFIQGVVEKLIDRFQSMLREIPIFGGLLAGIGGVAKSMSGILTAALIAAFAWSKLKGPVGQFTSQVSKSFQGLKVLSAGGALTADDRKAYTAAGTEAKNAVSRRLQAAADAAGEKPGSNGPSVLTAALRSKENIALIKEEQRAVLERQFGAQKASRIIQQAAADEAAATRRTAKTTEDAARAQNLSRYGIAGNLLNAKLGFDEATASVKKFYGTISDGSLLAKAKRALATVTGTRGLATRSNDALERLRTNNELDRLKAIGRSDRTPEQNARFASLQATLGPTTVPQRLQDAGAEVRNAAAARLRQRELDAAQQRAVRSLEVSKLPGVAGLPGATAAIDAMRDRFRSIGTELATLDTKGTGVLGRLGVAVSKVTIAAADTAERFGKLGLGEAIENFGRKFAGLDPLVQTQTDGIASKFKGMIDRVSTGLTGFADNVKAKFRAAFGPDGDGAQSLIAAAEIAVGGFLSGKTIATSSGLEGKLVGIAGAVGSIAAGFAVGGPIGAGLAAVTAAIGYISGSMEEAKRKQDDWTASVSDLISKYVDARKEVDGLETTSAETTSTFLRDNLTGIEGLAKGVPGLQKIIGDALLSTGEGGSLDAATKSIRDKVTAAFGTESVPVLKGLSDQITNGKNAKFAQAIGDVVGTDINDAMRNGLFKGMTETDAKRLAEVMRKGIKDGVAAGTIDASHLLDTFTVKAGDDGYEVVQNRVKGLGELQTSTLQAVFEQLQANTTAVAESNSETGQLVNKYSQAKDEAKGVGAALDGVLTKTDLATAVAETLRQKFADAADAAAGINPNQNDATAEAIAKGATGGGTDTAAKNLKALYDAALPVREAIRGLADALTTTDEAGNKVTLSLSDALSGSLGTEVRDKVTQAQSKVNEAFAAWAASAAKDPAIAANWATLGTDFMEKMRQAMLESATEAGGVDFGQKLIDSLNIPDEALVHTALAEADQEHLKDVVGKDYANMQALWDKNKVVISFDAQPSPATVKALADLGFTVLGPDGKALAGSSAPSGVRVPTRDPDVGPRNPTTIPPRAAVPTRNPDGTATTKAGATYDSITQQIKADVARLPAFKAWTANETKVGLPYFFQQKIGELQKNPSGAARIDLVNKMFEVGHRFPYFAQGDVVNRPTVGVFGEAGPEVIVPLSKPKRMIQLLSKALTMTGHLTGMLPKFAEGAIVGGKGGGTPRFQQGLYRKLTEKMPMDQLLRLLDFNVNTYASTAFALTRSPADRAVGARVLDARRPVVFTIGDLTNKTRDWSEREFDYVRPTIRRARDVLQSTEGIAAWASAMLAKPPTPNRRVPGGWNKALGSLNTGKVGGMPKFADGAIFGGGMPSPVPMGNQAQATSDRDTMSALLDELRMMRQASAYNETNNYNIHGQSDPHGTALATMAERKADRFRSAKPRRF